jgi:hypothetical protein
MPQINWDGRVLGCCRNFWGEFGGNAFADGVVAVSNGERMGCARDMLLGKQPPREDVPCSTCDQYLSMSRDRRWLAPSEVRLSPRLARWLYRRGLAKPAMFSLLGVLQQALEKAATAGSRARRHWNAQHE